MLMCSAFATLLHYAFQPYSLVFFVHAALISGALLWFYPKPGRGQFLQPRMSLQETLTDLFKYLAIARRARGDLPGAKEALARVESLGGSKDVEALDRLMAENKISVD